MIEHGRKMVDPSRFLAVVDPEKCEACGTCDDRCFFSAVTTDEVTSIDRDKCMGCGVCQITCPAEAISLVEVREKEFVPTV